MTLREQIATRLLSAYEKRDEPGRFGQLTESQQACFLNMADEVIRQMHWAASELGHFHRSCEGYDDREDAELEAWGRITMAPDDWKGSRP